MAQQPDLIVADPENHGKVFRINGEWCLPSPANFTWREMDTGEGCWMENVRHQNPVLGDGSQWNHWIHIERMEAYNARTLAHLNFMSKHFVRYPSTRFCRERKFFVEDAREKALALESAITRLQCSMFAYTPSVGQDYDRVYGPEKENQRDLDFNDDPESQYNMLLGYSAGDIVRHDPEGNPIRKDSPLMVHEYNGANGKQAITSEEEEEEGMAESPEIPQPSSADDINNSIDIEHFEA